MKAAVAGRMQNTGQACNAAKRLIVVDDVYDEFVDRFSAVLASMQPGDPSDPDTQYGPLSSEQAATSLIEQIDDAVGKGATVRAGGKRVDRPGAYVEPTVLTDVTPEMRAYREELFGPAAVVYRVADADEAVALANDSAFGLGGVVFGADAGRDRGRRRAASTPAWCGSTACRAAWPTCPSAARSAPASGASSARSASTSS